MRSYGGELRGPFCPCARFCRRWLPQKVGGAAAPQREMFNGFIRGTSQAYLPERYYIIFFHNGEGGGKEGAGGAGRARGREASEKGCGKSEAGPEEDARKKGAEEGREGRCGADEVGVGVSVGVGVGVFVGGSAEEVGGGCSGGGGGGQNVSGRPCCFCGAAPRRRLAPVCNRLSPARCAAPCPALLCHALPSGRPLPWPRAPRNTRSTL